MGRKRKKNTRRRCSTRRRQSQVHHEINGDNHKLKSNLTAPKVQLPLGACVELKNFTTLFLFDGNKNYLRVKWNETCSQLLRFYSREVIFDAIDKCIVYIKQKHLTRVYLHVFNDDITALTKIRETITDACQRIPLKEFYVSDINNVRFGRDGMIITGSREDELEKKADDGNEMALPMAVYGLTHGPQRSIQDLTKDEVRFMWFQLLLDLLLRLPRHTTAMHDMLVVARSYYSIDPTELRKIDDFACTYHSTKAAWWYTQDSFVYRLLNNAFRTQDIRIIFAFRSYIIDLYTQLTDIAATETNPSWHTAFRGQILLIDELEAIKKNVGGLISMNTFLSTTLNCQVACMLAGYGTCSATHAAVLFEITMGTDCERSLIRPFASISSHSDKHDEREVLFAMGSVFRIVSFDQYETMCLVDLQICNQPTEHTAELSAHLRSRYSECIVNELTLADLLLQMGEINQVEQFYKIMIGQEDPDQFELEIAQLQNSIGLWHIHRGDYKSAKILFEQALNLSNDYPSMKDVLLNNLGLVWLNEGYYRRALKFFKQSKKCRRSKKSIQTIYSNMSSAYVGIGQYEIAKQYAYRALTIEKKHNPPSHPDLAHTYGKLAIIESRLGNYSSALTLSKESLTLLQQSLPPNHHLLAHAFNNIGSIYNDLEDADRALEYYEEALKIQSQSFEQNKDNHLLVAASLNNIASCQFAKNNFQEAEAAFKRVLETKLAILGDGSSLHPSLAIAYNNLALAQMKQGRFDEAMINYQRTLAIEQSMGDRASLCSTYNNIGGIYDERGDFVNAQHFYSKAYNTARALLPKNHPNVQMYLRHMEQVKVKSKANTSNTSVL